MYKIVVLNGDGEIKEIPLSGERGQRNGPKLIKLDAVWIAFSAHLEIKTLLRISFARNATDIIVIIGRGVWVCPKELCAQAERESQDRQNKYSHHLAIITFYLGCFTTQDEAHATYIGAMRLLNGYDPVTNQIVGEPVSWSNVWTDEMWTELVNARESRIR